jgi:hypothetical protein
MAVAPLSLAIFIPSGNYIFREKPQQPTMLNVCDNQNVSLLTLVHAMMRRNLKRMVQRYSILAHVALNQKKVFIVCDSSLKMSVQYVPLVVLSITTEKNYNRVDLALKS